jgi:hypothetical protein
MFYSPSISISYNSNPLEAMGYVWVQACFLSTLHVLACKKADEDNGFLGNRALEGLEVV